MLYIFAIPGSLTVAMIFAIAAADTYAQSRWCRMMICVVGCIAALGCLAWLAAHVNAAPLRSAQEHIQRDCGDKAFARYELATKRLKSGLLLDASEAFLAACRKTKHKQTQVHIDRSIDHIERSCGPSLPTNEFRAVMSHNSTIEEIDALERSVVDQCS